jgi:hypothetical protein
MNMLGAPKYTVNRRGRTRATSGGVTGGERRRRHEVEPRCSVGPADCTETKHARQRNKQRQEHQLTGGEED